MTDVITSPAEPRVIDGRPVPPAGQYAIDPSHSTVEFVARHLMVAKTRGRFTNYEASVEIGERPEDSKLSVTIDASSITTGDDGRDAHLRSPDFLDLENHPSITFVSSSVEPKADDHWQVTGDFTVRGVTKPLTLDVEFNGSTTDPWGNAKAFFSASGEIDRDEYGVSWNQPLANGGVVVGKKVRIEIEVEAVKQ
jgi:polyisoprenoid-binding protein YceI